MFSAARPCFSVCRMCRLAPPMARFRLSGTSAAPPTLGAPTQTGWSLAALRERAIQNHQAIALEATDIDNQTCCEVAVARQLQHVVDEHTRVSEGHHAASAQRGFNDEGSAGGKGISRRQRAAEIRRVIGDQLLCCATQEVSSDRYCNREVLTVAIISRILGQRGVGADDAHSSQQARAQAVVIRQHHASASSQK